MTTAHPVRTDMLNLAVVVAMCMLTAAVKHWPVSVPVARQQWLRAHAQAIQHTEQRVLFCWPCLQSQQSKLALLAHTGAPVAAATAAAAQHDSCHLFL